MGIFLTANEARVLRDALRTDYALREELVEAYTDDPNPEASKIMAEAKERLALLDAADDVLKSVYQYPDEPLGYMYQ
jgi:hypothetical protein